MCRGHVCASPAAQVHAIFVCMLAVAMQGMTVLMCVQQSCSEAASFDLRADLLADCIREVDQAAEQAERMREAGKRRQYDGLGLRVRFHTSKGPDCAPW